MKILQQIKNLYKLMINLHLNLPDIAKELLELLDCSSIKIFRKGRTVSQVQD